jgi:hypothetical protein
MRSPTLTRYFSPSIGHCCKPGGCDVAFQSPCTFTSSMATSGLNRSQPESLPAPPRRLGGITLARVQQASFTSACCLRGKGKEEQMERMRRARVERSFSWTAHDPKIRSAWCDWKSRGIQSRKFAEGEPVGMQWGCWLRLSRIPLLFDLLRRA